jgi:hypothetical protein
MGRHRGVSCLRSSLVGTGAVAISAQAAAAKLHSMASLAAILSQGLKAEKNPLPRQKRFPCTCHAVSIVYALEVPRAPRS